MQLTEIKCLICGDIIQSDGNGKWVQCSCKQCYIDQTEHYCRIGGDGDKTAIEVFDKWVPLNEHYNGPEPKIKIEGVEEDE
jgi:hypothetical protein